MVKVKKDYIAKSVGLGNYVKISESSKDHIKSKKDVKKASLKKNISKPLASRNTRSSKNLMKSAPISTLVVDEQNENIVNYRIVSEFRQKNNLLIENVENAIKGVLNARETNPKLEKQLFEECAPLFLNITCHKVPKGHTKILRIPLKNSVLTSEDEICLIVPEVKGIGNKDHEKHVEHYEDLLKRKGVSNIKKIMTLHELRTEYETFELKSRLVDLYEIFLVDGRISGKTVHNCGKIFYKKRKVPVSVKLNVTKLKEHIEAALSKVPLHLHLKGNGFTVQFGHTNMNVHELVDNLYCILEFLNKNFPGKFDNIKGLHVFGPRATSLPIYMSLKNPSELKVPIIKSKKPKAYKSVTGELTTQLNTQVIVMPTGKVLVKKTKDVDNENDDSKITDEDIIRSNKAEKKLPINKSNGDDNVKTLKLKKRANNSSDADKETETNINRETVGENDDAKPKLNKGTKKKNKNGVVSIIEKEKNTNENILQEKPKKNKKVKEIPMKGGSEQSEKNKKNKKEKQNVENVEKFKGEKRKLKEIPMKAGSEQSDKKNLENSKKPRKIEENLRKDLEENTLISKNKKVKAATVKKDTEPSKKKRKTVDMNLMETEMKDKIVEINIEKEDVPMNKNKKLKGSPTSKDNALPKKSKKTLEVEVLANKKHEKPNIVERKKRKH